eukprot:6486819-Amphidinium_carterae.1
MGFEQPVVDNADILEAVAFAKARDEEEAHVLDTALSCVEHRRDEWHVATSSSQDGEPKEWPQERLLAVTGSEKDTTTVTTPEDFDAAERAFQSKRLFKSNKRGLVPETDVPQQLPDDGEIVPEDVDEPINDSWTYTVIQAPPKQKKGKKLLSFERCLALRLVYGQGPN